MRRVSNLSRLDGSPARLAPVALAKFVKLCDSKDLGTAAQAQAQADARAAVKQMLSTAMALSEQVAAALANCAAATAFPKRWHETIN